MSDFITVNGKLFLALVRSCVDISNGTISGSDKEYDLVRTELVDSLHSSLKDIQGSLRKDYTKLQEKEIKKEEECEITIDINIPKNVIVTLIQYRSWGIDLWNYDAVLKKAEEYSDLDVIEFISVYRHRYSQIIKLMTDK